MPTDFSEMKSLGEEAVRLKLANLEWEGTQAKAAEHWLALCTSRRIEAVDRRAWIAIVIAAIAAAKEIKWLTNSIAGWFQ